MISEVVLKIVLAPVFFLLLTPVAVVVRLCGIDVLDKNSDKNAKSYWQAADTQSSTTGDTEPDNRS